jgi:hypothetical protein
MKKISSISIVLASKFFNWSSAKVDPRYGGKKARDKPEG